MSESHTVPKRWAKGIEHDANMRTVICEGLSWAWPQLNLGRTQDGQPVNDADTPTPREPVRVHHSNEEAQIAIHTSALALKVP